jgi:hypothetical protein
MIAPSESTARAINNLSGNANWQEVLRWIEESAMLQSVRNNYNRGEEAIIMQGRNTELADFLKHVGKVDNYLANAREKKIMEE